MRGLGYRSLNCLQIVPDASFLSTIVTSTSRSGELFRLSIEQYGNSALYVSEDNMLSFYVHDICHSTPQQRVSILTYAKLICKGNTCTDYGRKLSGGLDIGLALGNVDFYVSANVVVQGNLTTTS